MQENLKIQQKELLIRPFTVPIYDWTVVLLIGEEDTALNLIETKECCQLENCYCGVSLGSTFQPKSTIYIWYPSDASLKTKCHEILHATFYILNSVGVDIRDQEAVCYLFEYILDQCLKLDEKFIQTEVVSIMENEEDTQQ